MPSQRKKEKKLNNRCSICNKPVKKIIENKFGLCKSCGVIVNFTYEKLDYDESYFTDEYKKQYGKSYVEDYDNIYSYSIERLNKIFDKLTKKKELKLLDIGCAYGFFCKAALDMGVNFVSGIEISKIASNYCIDKYGFDIYNGDFLKYDSKERYDIITAWYIIEHFENTVVALKKIFNLLNHGGVFAGTLPSFYGPLYKYNLKLWAKEHPIDHKLDFSPKGIKKLLHKIGFQQIYCYPAAYHPERAKGLLFKFPKLYKIYSDFICFSDTIMFIAKKI